ncbi:SAM-dependent methyltransferase, partial [Flavobacterium sp. IR1]
MFSNYELILESVAQASKGLVLEFGVGTGNLTEKLLERSLDVIGIEPSSAMRHLAQTKIANLLIMDGDFLSYNLPVNQVDTIVSTYAFHHLTDQEKHQAIRQYKNILSSDGSIVFADTIFLSTKHKYDFI